MRTTTRRRFGVAILVAALLAGVGVTTAAAHPSDVQPSGYGRLTVVLTDVHDGAPLAGDCALSFVVQGDQSQPPVVNDETRCVGAHGRVSFAGLPAPDYYTVHVHDQLQQYVVAGAERQFLVRNGAETVASLPVVRTGSIAGAVTHAGSGSPDAGDCTIRVLVGAGAGEYLGCTDSHGRYRLDGIRPGSYSVRFTSYKYKGTTWPTKVAVRPDDVTSGIDDKVRPGSSAPPPPPSPTPSPTPSATGSPSSADGQLTLVLTNLRTGETLAGDCALTFEVGAYRSPSYGVTEQRCVGADGRVTFTVPGPNYYSVSIVDKSHNFVGTGTGGRRIFVQPGKETVFDLPQRPAGSMTGTITFLATGEPDANDCNLRVSLLYGPDFEGCTDSHGRYRLTGLKPTGFLVNFTDNNHVSYWYPNAPSQEDSQKVRVQGEHTTAGVDGVLQDGAALQVTLVNGKTGRPMPRAFVAWHLVKATKYEVLDFSEWRTSCQGRFTIHRIFATGYRLFVRLGSNYSPDQWYRGTKYGNAAVLVLRNKQTAHITLRVDPTKVVRPSNAKPAAPC